MKLTTTIIALLLCSCSTTPSPTSKDFLDEQANSYAARYKEKNIERMNSLTIESKGHVVESFYFNKPQKFIRHKVFNINPNKQFHKALEEQPSIPYNTAKKMIQVKTTNYFSSDCDSIETFFDLLETFEPNYKAGRYSLKLNSPTYKYIYKNKKSPITHIIITAIEEHPVVNLSEKSRKAINNCPHPKEPPKI